MANAISTHGTLVLDTAGGQDGPFRIHTVILDPTTAAGDYVLRGTNLATGPVLLQCKNQTAGPVVITLNLKRSVAGLYLSALPTGGRVCVICD